MPQALETTPNVFKTAESGWAAVAKSIHEVDLTKVADVKEDIDNILVFAGLYSAVLSALIAISIIPQSDSSSVTNGLLTQLVSQMRSYIITSQFINSTATAPILEAAIPASSSSALSLTAKRVNVLWIASLTLALITASFGILVKQWIREYLAVKHVSPQARLRIRHFRKPGLEDWHVYGIASLLPLIIQLALALFFVGLCFFTLHIDTSIGYTTIPLVAMWALFFLFTALAPSISPRCPYKIPLLKPLMPALREPPTHPIRRALLPSGTTESDVADSKERDAEILMEIAETQGDDELLAKICRAAKETLPSQERFDLFLDILRSRLPHREDDYHFTDEWFQVNLELKNVPPRTLTILLDSFADILLEEVETFTSSQSIKWVPQSWNSLMLLFAQLPCPLSANATNTVARCFSATNYLRVYDIFEPMFRDIQDSPLYQANRRLESDDLVMYLVDRLDHISERLSISEVLQTLYRLFIVHFCRNEHECRSLQECFDRHRDGLSPSMVSRTSEVLRGRMLAAVKDDITWGRWHDNVMRFLCKHRYIPNEQEQTHPWDFNIELKVLVRAILLRPDTMVHFGWFLYDSLHFDEDCTSVFQITLLHLAETDAMLYNLRKAIQDYVIEAQKIPGFIDHAFYSSILRFLSGHIVLMREFINDSANLQSTLASIHLPIVRSIMKTVHSVLQRYKMDAIGPPSDITQQASSILKGIDELDEVWILKDESNDWDFTIWAETPEREDLISDELIADLVRFLRSRDTRQRSRRVRAIQYLQQHSKHLQRSLPSLHYWDPEDEPPAAPTVAPTNL